VLEDPGIAAAGEGGPNRANPSSSLAVGRADMDTECPAVSLPRVESGLLAMCDTNSSVKYPALRFMTEWLRPRNPPDISAPEMKVISALVFLTEVRLVMIGKKEETKRAENRQLV
jgi:hypothetical protein